MIHVETLQPKLAELASVPTPFSWTTDLETRDWSLTVAVERADSLSLLIGELRLEREHAGDVTTLAAIADDLTQRLSFLSEPVRVIEFDRERNAGMLRSTPPSVWNGHRLYFEIMLMGTQSISMRRYRVSIDSPTTRESIPFAMTHETLMQTLDSLTVA